MLQVLISNHEVPKELKPLHPGRALNFKRVPLRAIEYKDNQGYKLVIDRMPWGKSSYTDPAIPASTKRTTSAGGKSHFAR